MESVETGRLGFLPWVTLPAAIKVGDYEFVPIKTNDLSRLMSAAVASTAQKTLHSHVTQSGQPITSCTLILDASSNPSWDLDKRNWNEINEAVKILSIAALSEQRFRPNFFNDHLNASMFRLIGQRIRTGDDTMSLDYPRRGGLLRVGGRTFAKTVFQQPYQVEESKCTSVNQGLATALWNAKISGSEAWDRFAASIDFFLLGHSEEPVLSTATCVMLSAMAFEKLLNARMGARAIADAFRAAWDISPSSVITLSAAHTATPDPVHESEQASWPLHWKWMKELVEARNAGAHTKPTTDRSENWQLDDHIMIAAFSYPILLKRVLEQSGYYAMTDIEKIERDALDALLNTDFQQESAWQSTLDERIGEYRIRQSLAAAWDKVLTPDEN